MIWDFKALLALLILAAATAGAAGSLADGDTPARTSRAPATFWQPVPVLTPAPWRVEGRELAAVIPPLTSVQPARLPRRDLWLAKDKADHLVVSAVLTGLGYYATRQEMNLPESRSRNMAPALSFSFGLAKELRDRRRPNGFFSIKDLGADLLGCGLGYLFCALGDF